MCRSFARTEYQKINQAEWSLCSKANNSKRAMFVGGESFGVSND